VISGLYVIMNIIAMVIETRLVLTSNSSLYCTLDDVTLCVGIAHEIHLVRDCRIMLTYVKVSVYFMR
jgi:hypothetical protein